MLHKEQSQLVVIAKQIATQFTDSACNLATATCYLNEVAVGLFITKKLFRQAIEPSIELMMTAIKAIAGESKFFNMIIPIFEQYIANEKIYMQNPSEVFAKGTTLYLNQLNATNENIYKNANENITEEFEAAKEHVKTALINPGCNA